MCIETGFLRLEIIIEMPGTKGEEEEQNMKMLGREAVL